MEGMAYQHITFFSPLMFGSVAMKRFVRWSSMAIRSQTWPNAFQTLMGQSAKGSESFVATWPLARQPFAAAEPRGRPAVAADDSELAIAIADIEAGISLEPGRRLSLGMRDCSCFCRCWPGLASINSSSRLVIRARQWFRSQRLTVSLLVLKLLDKERLSHIDDFNCDEALGLFLLVSIFCPRKALPPTTRIAQCAKSIKKNFSRDG